MKRFMVYNILHSSSMLTETIVTQCVDWDNIVQYIDWKGQAWSADLFQEEQLCIDE